MGFFDALSRGLERSREALNEVFYFGGEVDEDFWEDLEDTLVMGDMGAEVAIQVSDDLRDAAAKKNLKTAPQLRRALAEQLEQHFVPIERDPFSDTPSCVLFVGINGAGKHPPLHRLEPHLPQRRRAMSRSAMLEGKWIERNARALLMSFRFARSGAGIGSNGLPTPSSAPLTMRRIHAWLTPSLT